MHKDQLANRVKERRQNRNLTQEELAQRIDVSRQTIIAIEKGNYIPSVALALRLAVVFHCQVEDIFYWN